MKSTGTLNHKKEAWQSAYDFSLEIMINNGEKADCRGRWSSLAKTGGILSLRAPDAKSTETLNHKKGCGSLNVILFVSELRFRREKRHFVTPLRELQ